MRWGEPGNDPDCSRLELCIAIWLAVLIGGFGYVLLLIVQTAAVN